MTRAERASLIDRLEFEAECRAARARALQYVETRQQEEAARVAGWIGKEPPPTFITRPKLGRKPKLYEHAGERKSLSEWADIAGVTYRTLQRRIRTGMLFQTAITMKPHGRQSP